MSSQKGVSSKVVVVTGAASGIGRAIAQRFGVENARVVVNDIDAEGAEVVAQSIIANGGSAMAFTADVSDKAQVDAMFDATVEKYETVDVLVNNAGLVSPMIHFLEADEAWWRRILDVNLTSVFLCSHRAAHIMARQGDGVIINMSSGGATRAHRGFTAYDATKGGIEAVTRAMALDLGPYGIRVNALVPGSIDTSGLDEEARKLRGENIPIGRVGEADDMAGPAIFLASDDARYITGHRIFVDGGMLAQQRSATVDIFPVSSYPNIEDLK
ncbi:MAG: SDR family NAD(P)-dependent oxidoreductase [Chloroflexota bacterium]